MRRYLLVLFMMIMIPYITTLAWTGKLETAEWHITKDSTVIVERNEISAEQTVEDYLVHVLAAQIPAEFEAETLKAQAILARTYIYSLLGTSGKIYEEELDMDALSIEQMKTLWEETDYPARLQKLQAAVNETAGLYLIYEGEMIEPLYCYASAGKTRSRSEDYPYLKQTESPGDLLAENYRSLPVFEMKDFARRIHEIPGSAAVSEEELINGGGIQIVERDSSGYVKLVQIGQKTYTGEEVQYALGLASSCYSFERLDRKIRVICKGIGHGFGFSQFGANEMAKEGASYEELLHHYFQNVEIIGVEEK